jgi:glycosyltransferase involved in cell wall biosynthesis
MTGQKNHMKNKIDFSIIFPTRNNVKGLKRFFNSLERTTKRKDRLEVLIAVDDDDEQLKEICEATSKYSFDIQIYLTQRTDNFSDDYYNFLSSKANGRNIWACNDDIWIRTDGWDNLIRQAIKRVGWSIYMVDVNDSTRFHKETNQVWPCFPMVSKEAIDVMGFLFYPQIRVYPADKVIYQLFLNIVRVIECLDVEVVHDHIPETSPAKSRLMRLFLEDKASGALNVNITKELSSLLRAINNERITFGLWLQNTKRLISGR